MTTGEVEGYPRNHLPEFHVEPCPRRVRAVLGGRTVLDTTAAHYVWEWPHYPQLYVPAGDVVPDLLGAPGEAETDGRGTFDRRRVVGTEHEAVVVGASPLPGLAGTVRLRFEAADAWYEEDEQVFVHPRSPYVRVDALRSTRRVRVELDGVVLAESDAPVLVFETGLPTRYYLPRTAVRFAHLVPSETVTECPYKGTTSHYWSVRTADGSRDDLAWSYDFPTRQLLPVTGMVAFLGERVDHVVDGVHLDRPRTHMS